MKLKLPNLFFLGVIILCFTNCSKDETSEEYIPIANTTSPVNYNLDAFPYATLSEYNLFEGELKNQNPVNGVIPYEPISTLFTDYAKKKRFVWMPQNASASIVLDSEVLNFPVGTILIKTFYYTNVLPNNSTKILETRVMIRKSSGWIFSEYVWNEEQTEAFLDNSGSYVAIEWLENGISKSTNYRIPSESECLTCHKKSNNPIPIGLKPQNINSNYSYASGTTNQLQKLMDVGYLNQTDYSNINTVVNWKDTSKSLNLRARSYLDINCAHCHSSNSHCSYRPIRLSFVETAFSEDNIGICVVPDEDIASNLTHIISPSRPEKSVLSYRMNSIEESTKMPLLGRTIVDEEAVILIDTWINQLTQICN